MMKMETLEKVCVGAIIGIMLTLAMFKATPCRADGFYVDVGIGYKLQEAEVFHEYHGKMYTYDDNNSPTAHIAAGYLWENGVSLELSHDSNWLNGWPVNDKWEYHRTEVRAVKRFSF